MYWTCLAAVFSVGVQCVLTEVHSTRVLYCNSYCVVVMCVVLQDKLVLSQQEVQQRVQQREKELKELQQAVESLKVSIRISTTGAVLLGDTWIGQVDSLHLGRLVSLEGFISLSLSLSFFLPLPLPLPLSSALARQQWRTVRGSSLS